MPVGVRVFLGYGATVGTARESRGYIGQTPCEMVVKVDGDGGWQVDGAFLMSAVVSAVAVVSATHEGVTREQVFHAGALGRPADKVPQAILFDFTAPAPPATPVR